MTVKKRWCLEEDCGRRKYSGWRIIRFSAVDVYERRPMYNAGVLVSVSEHNVTGRRNSRATRSGSTAVLRTMCYSRRQCD